MGLAALARPMPQKKKKKMKTVAPQTAPEPTVSIVSTDTDIIDKVRHANLQRTGEKWSGVLAAFAQDSANCEWLLEYTLKSAYEDYMEMVCDGLVRERITFAVRTTYRALGKPPLTIPNEAFDIIIAFAGDALNINPMTAVLARAMATIRSAWEHVEARLISHFNAVEQCRLVDEVMVDVSAWWDENGGQHVSDAFVRKSGNKRLVIVMSRSAFPAMFRWMEKLVWKHHLYDRSAVDEELAVVNPEDSHLLEQGNFMKRLQSFFTQEPLGFHLAPPWLSKASLDESGVAHPVPPSPAELPKKFRKSFSEFSMSNEDLAQLMLCPREGGFPRMMDSMALHLELLLHP